MCGYLSAEKNPGFPETLRSMLQAMSRGPARHEESADVPGGGVVGIQPPESDEHRLVWNDDRSACLALCGRVVTPGGPEEAAQYVLSLLESHGEDALPDLNGVFALAYYDLKKRTLTVANDRYGFMPLYYRHDGDKFAFASEAKALLEVSDRRELDWEGCADFLYTGQVLGAKTLFEGVFALEAGEVLTFRDGRLHKRRYHDFTKTPVLHPGEVSTGRLAALFETAVRRGLRPGGVDTLLLSGGFDSRLILGAMVGLGAKPNVVSLENATGTQGEDDGHYAALVAEHLGLECDFRRTRADFFASRDCVEAFHALDGMVPAWGSFMVEVHPELDADMGAVWDGLAMGIVLGGQHQVKGGAKAFLEKFAARRRVNRLLLPLILSPRYFRRVDRSFARRLREELERIPDSENRYQNFLLKNRTGRRISVISYGLFADKVEPVTPAADKDFLDYALAIPHSLKANHKLYADLMTRHFPSLTQVPVTSSGAIWRFDPVSGMSREPSKKSPPRSKRTLERIRKAAGTLARITTLDRMVGARIPRTSADKYEASGLIISTLQRKLFDRPCYNTWLLRRLFTVYRNGNAVYHKLFLMVFYIELWHLLFVDGHPPATLFSNSPDRRFNR